jgi:Zn-finger nucleic acid-binding protein
MHCPQCRGAWLDQGELDNLIAASDETAKSYFSPVNDSDDYRKKEGRPFHKRKSLLSEIFDL